LRAGQAAERSCGEISRPLHRVGSCVASNPRRNSAAYSLFTTVR
jgi:hypothetical protein